MIQTTEMANKNLEKIFLYTGFNYTILFVKMFSHSLNDLRVSNKIPIAREKGPD